MKLRKLNREEHSKTRALWEEIFCEDSQKFLDYYYTCKTSENEIYVIEEEGQLVSMLHLNPYQMRIKHEIYPTHYIVAVATKEAYRGRGYMRALLEHVLKVMTERGEPFTFLMPASPAIYEPFGFAYIYEQRQEYVIGKKYVIKGLQFTDATVEECTEIADFANSLLAECDVVTWRDASYYEMLLAEQKSEQGGILLARREGQLVGAFCYAPDETLEDARMMLREPLCYDREVLEAAVYQLTHSEEEQVFCIGFGEMTKPMIMARILHPEMAENLEQAAVFLNEIV